MTTLIECRRVNDFIIAYVTANDTDKVLGFTICHLDLERATAELFRTAAKAQEWGEKYYKGLLNKIDDRKLELRGLNDIQGANVVMSEVKEGDYRNENKGRE